MPAPAKSKEPRDPVKQWMQAGLIRARAVVASKNQKRAGQKGKGIKLKMPKPKLKTVAEVAPAEEAAAEESSDGTVAGSGEEVVDSDGSTVPGDVDLPSFDETEIDFPEMPEQEDGQDGGEEIPNARIERAIGWGPKPWAIAEIWHGGVHIGWGGTCRCHTNGWNPLQVCKKALLFGDNTSDETRCLIKQWLIMGQAISPSSYNGKMRHVQGVRRNRIPLRPEHELDADAASLMPRAG